jgi:hypothetical protein
MGGSPGLKYDSGQSATSNKLSRVRHYLVRKKILAEDENRVNTVLWYKKVPISIHCAHVVLNVKKAGVGR